MDSRGAAIASLGHLDKENKEITQQIASYLTEPHFTARWAAISALGNRGDASAIPALEALLKADDLSIEMVPEIKQQIERLQNPKGAGGKSRGDEETEDEDVTDEMPENRATVSQRLEQLERLVQEMSDRLKSIESRLPAPARN
jgi:methyl-accepting chemotaxis protein